MNNITVTIEKKILTVTQPGHPTHTFRIVKTVPKGYGVWPIGAYMGTEEYIPFCESKQGYGPYSVNPDTLLAVKLPREEVLLLRKASAYGGTITQWERALKRKGSAHLATPDELRQAIEILQRIKEDQ